MWHILEKNALSSEIRELLSTQKESYDLKFEYSYLRVWSFQPPTSIFGTEELYMDGLPPSFP